MPRYILIDSNSGFVWGEAQARNAIDACRAVEKSVGVRDRIYEMRGPASRALADGASGYYVYVAVPGFELGADGKDAGAIEAVQALELVAQVLTTDKRTDDYISAARILGAKGGRMRTEAQRLARRINGAKGGRPRKDTNREG